MNSQNADQMSIGCLPCNGFGQWVDLYQWNVPGSADLLF